MRSKKIRIDKPYLMLPLGDSRNRFIPEKNRQILSLRVDTVLVEEYELVLSPNPRTWAALDLTRYSERDIEVRLEGGDEKLLDMVVPSGTPQDFVSFYHEDMRPLVHLTPRHGSMNDPNGLYYYAGEYHCFAQLNPYGFNTGNTHWMHCVSTDLVRWRQEPCALLPDETGLMYSGSGVVDYHNTSGLQSGEIPPVFLFYTAAGSKSRWSRGRRFEIAAAYSLDGGQTYVKYEDNPVVSHMQFMNRDPKVIWVPEINTWVMVIYLYNDIYRLLCSGNLLRWETMQDVSVTHAAECPDLFRLALDGDPARFYWILWGSPDNYIVGSFEGQHFIPVTGTVEGPCHRLASALSTAALSPGGYAAQTFNNLPDGRVVQMSWINTRPNHGPFLGCLSIPNEVKLVSTPEGPRLSILPAEELDALVADSWAFTDRGLEELCHIPPRFFGEAMDMTFRLTVTPGRIMAVSVRGVLIAYDPETAHLLLPCGAYDVKAPDGLLTLRVITDRCSMEIYADNGLFNLALAVMPDSNDISVRVVDLDPSVGVDFTIRTLNNMWQKE